MAFKWSYKAKNSKSVVVEYFTEYEKLCCDISDEIHNVELERDAERDRLKRRYETLILVGEEVLSIDMNRRIIRERDFDEDDTTSSTTSKKDAFNATKI